MALAVILVPAVASAAPARYDDTNGITISPPINKISLGPGLVEATTKVVVTNNTNYQFSANLKLVDFKSLNQNGGLTLGQVGVPLWKYGLANWMSLPGGGAISIAPGKTLEVPVNIQNRADLIPGGHYGAVVISAEEQGKAATASNKVGFSQNLVSLLFVKKLGGEKYGLDMASLAARGGFGLPESVSMRFKSTGNVYVIPRGYVEVTDPKGIVVRKGIINQNSNIIMQGDTAELISLLKPVADSGRGGTYKITAHYRYEGQEGYDTKTVYVHISRWPWRATIAAVITGVIGIAVMLRLQRKSTYSIKK